jgi:hypothetical protein
VVGLLGTDDFRRWPEYGCGVSMTGGGVIFGARGTRAIVGQLNTIDGVRAGMAVDKGKMFTSDLVTNAALPAASKAVYNTSFAIISYVLEGV